MGIIQSIKHEASPSSSSVKETKYDIHEEKFSNLTLRDLEVIRSISDLVDKVIDVNTALMKRNSDLEAESLKVKREFKNMQLELETTKETVETLKMKLLNQTVNKLSKHW